MMFVLCRFRLGCLFTFLHVRRWK